MAKNTQKTLFPNYTQINPILPLRFWHVVRVFSVIALFSLAIYLLRVPENVSIFWRVVVRCLPIIFIVAPGVWRNACPLAASNQVPRLFGFTRGLTLSPWLKHYAYVFGLIAFFSVASSRKWLFNTDGTATAILLLTAITLAFIGGFVFKGKSGWCGTFCPLIPLQRVYGQTPFLVSPNSYCQPCVGCIKNCYDFNPRVAYMADLYDDDRRYTGYRRFFVSAIPGFVFGYFVIPNPPAVSISEMYFFLLLSTFVSIAIFNVLETFATVTLPKLTTIFAALAFNTYYWFAVPDVLNYLEVSANSAIHAYIVYGARIGLGLVTLVWIWRTYRVELGFLQATTVEPTASVSESTLDMLKKSSSKDRSEVIFLPDEKVLLAEANKSLLDVAKSGGLNIDEGCRAGACGSDPVVVIEGMENLSPATEEELATLKRLGLSGRCRMACSARVQGRVKVEIGKEVGDMEGGEAVEFDASIKNIVIVGNGAAGLTAAETIRGIHPDCGVTLLGQEPHNFYKRLSINKLIVGYKGLAALDPFPESWYQEHKIQNWINTKAARIKPEEQKLVLGTGEELEYDRLILATGGHSLVVSPFDINLKGVFALREANDTIAIRAYIQEYQVKRAVVVGSGPLGVETAETLHKIGVKPILLSKSATILHRHIDNAASDLLVAFLRGLGIDIVSSGTTKKVIGERKMEGLELEDGRKVECQMAVLCTGIVPNIGLGEESGLKVGKGIVVGTDMRTSSPNIFAAGDVAEVDGMSFGLWTVAVEQGRIAAVNALGGDKRFIGSETPMILKLEGFDVITLGDSIGNRERAEFTIFSELDNQRYGRLTISEDKIIGAIFVGMSDYFPVVSKLIRDEVSIESFRQELNDGKFEVLLNL